MLLMATISPQASSVEAGLSGNLPFSSLQAVLDQEAGSAMLGSVDGAKATCTRHRFEVSHTLSLQTV